MLEAEGLGFSRFVSVGNQADVTLTDVLASCVDDDDSRVVACYLEDPVDGRAFVAALRALAEAGKPALVLPGGRSELGSAAARSHTGALAGSARVTAAAVRDAGGIVVRTPAEIVERAKALLAPTRLRGRRIAVLADGGGHGVVATDLLTDAGFELAVLQPSTAERLAPELPNSRPTNPVDMAGRGGDGRDVVRPPGARAGRGGGGRRRPLHGLLRRLRDLLRRGRAAARWGRRTRSRTAPRRRASRCSCTR